ncbi:sensor histidine kinase, partial [Paracoccus binzhouensis]|uniref:sensor histidine kinase n=1 Tax=Paracoccus binzhouensis TaxID=2796149 RepID=UPI001E5EEA6E
RTRAARRAEAERRYRADLERAVEARTRDLTAEMRERRAAEQRLAQLQGEMVQANKLATLGQITAGVAHEVNTPLATIRLLAENGQQLIPPGAPPEVSENLGRILRMSDRIAQITTELRSFARKATGEIGPVPLKEALDAALLLVASRRRAEGIRMVLPQIPPDLAVRGETVRLEQILVNLVQNAQEALSGRPDAELRIALSQRDGMVRLTVSDNGPGLAPDIAATLFTPFATSKPQGLGLGLVISHEIARDFGGSLTAEPPQPGRGASFHLDLPRMP